MQRPVRALAYALVLMVAYNALVIAATDLHSPAARIIGLFDHGAGCTLGIAAGCIATGEVGLLALYALLVLLLGWPVDLPHFAFAIVGGGMLGIAVRSFVLGHRNEPLPDRRQQ